jgi:hypothetical protein
MASNYIETETKATEEANSLPTNILSWGENDGQLSNLLRLFKG